MTLEIFFSIGLIISVFLMINISNLLTYFRGFLGILQLYSTITRGANWDVILIWPSLSNGKDIKGTNMGIFIQATGIENICTKDTYIENASTIKDTCIQGIFVRNSYIESTSIRVTNTIEYLRVHL